MERSDIAFAVGYMSRFMERLTMEHLQTIKRILCYVAGNLNYGLHYGRTPDMAQFVGYYDSDLARRCGYQQEHNRDDVLPR